MGCTQSFTRDELREFCLDPTNQHPMLTRQKTTMDNMEDFVFPKWLQTNQDMLGIFGNADPMQRNQWIAIESPTVVAKSRSFIETECRCIGMPSRLRFEILWTYVGNVDNPQAKILRCVCSIDRYFLLQSRCLVTPCVRTETNCSYFQIVYSVRVFQCPKVLRRRSISSTHPPLPQ